MATLELVAEAEALNEGLTFRVLLTRVLATARDGRDARAEMEEMRPPLPVMKTEIPARVGYSRAFGEPVEDLGAAPRPAGGKTVRITVDLDAERHRRLKQYALDAGARSAPVVRALLDELDEDPELSARVRTRLSAEAER